MSVLVILNYSIFIIDDVTSNGKSKKIGSNLLHHGRYNAATKPTFASELPFSVLKVDDKVPTLHIDVSRVLLEL